MSLYDQKLASLSESVLSESGYVAGSEGYTSQDIIYWDNIMMKRDQIKEI